MTTTPRATAIPPQRFITNPISWEIVTTNADGTRIIVGTVQASRFTGPGGFHAYGGDGRWLTTVNSKSAAAARVKRAWLYERRKQVQW